MGLLLILIAGPISLVTIFRRRRKGQSALVPALVLLYSVATFVYWIVTMIGVFAAVAGVVDPSMKAIVLAKGISETMNTIAFALVFNVPLLVCAWFVDRRLNKAPAVVAPPV